MTTPSLFWKKMVFVSSNTFLTCSVQPKAKKIEKRRSLPQEVVGCIFWVLQLESISIPFSPDIQVI
jgi:hypothetical protein